MDGLTGVGWSGYNRSENENGFHYHHRPAALEDAVSECRRTTLAEGRAGRVELCSCGTVHLSIGGVTVRLPAAAVRALRDMLDEAMRMDPAEAASRGEVRRRSVH